MLYAQQGVGALRGGWRLAVAVEFVLAIQNNGAAGGGAAQGARAAAVLLAHVQGLELVAGQALALGCVLEGVGSGVVSVGECDGAGGVTCVVGAGADGACALGADGAGVVATVVPAAEGDGMGAPLAVAAPAVDAVAGHGGADLGEFHLRVWVGLEGSVVVGNDEGVAA